MSLVTYLIIMLGGALGTLARYLLSLWALPISRDLPWGTILINVSGSFLIGLFGTLTLASGRFPVSENLRLFVMIGICGGFTTFSSFSLQTLDLLRSGAVIRASLNITLSVVLCVGAVALGHVVAERFAGAEVAIAQAAIEEEG
ncbi:MAG TPA: fluoride efflux transporter CrcB [Bosea sp. (in: a-proteobacteria)]|jgi:CrcB protein|uniref:fluoride efflux transporter CrcB n=1 Tax=Bosea sp. (in: a-proteobacteria) TaxID=1871050 RepID=UPI002E13130C|nr:fluoride efflux transporter CrcB [Bosea sp. (in: a-proteobacteria)]